jgi:hypothetical protein
MGRPRGAPFFGRGGCWTLPRNCSVERPCSGQANTSSSTSYARRSHSRPSVGGHPENMRMADSWLRASPGQSVATPSRRRARHAGPLRRHLRVSSVSKWTRESREPGPLTRLRSAGGASPRQATHRSQPSTLRPGSGQASTHRRRSLRRCSGQAGQASTSARTSEYRSSAYA